MLIPCYYHSRSILNADMLGLAIDLVGFLMACRLKTHGMKHRCCVARRKVSGPRVFNGIQR